MSFVLGIIYIIVMGAVLVSMTTLFLRGKKSLSNKMFLLFQGMVALWCGSQILLLLSKSHFEMVLSYMIGNVGICFTGSFLYYFAKAYKGETIKGWFKYVPVLISAMHLLCAFTNGLHHLYYRSFSVEQVEHGIFFYTNVIATYIFAFTGSVLLYRSLKGVSRGLIVGSVLAPVGLNAIYLLGIVRPAFDITPLGFAISVILVMFATVKYQFLDLKKELAITNEKLLLEQERNRIAQQVHDTAGHTLTMIQSYMKLADVSLQKQEVDTADTYIKDARELTSQGIKELRESINQLRQEATYELVTQGVMQLANQVKEFPVEVTVKGEDSEAYSHLSRVIYDTVRETITNTIKYADASAMDIVLKFQTGALELMIGDDGNGCENITDNNGLRGIKERVQKVGGTVKFISSKGEGFLTKVNIPIK